MIVNDITEELNKKIQEVQKKILSGEIKLLDLELVTLFDELKDALTVQNLEKSSLTYKNACVLLNQKFDELKSMLSSLESEKQFITYLNSNPSDLELFDLLNECWRKIFTIDTISLDFLELSQKRLGIDREGSITIEHLHKAKIKEKFLLEIPKHKFTEKMMKFFDTIRERLPCLLEYIFEDYTNQEIIYENFVYLLHLLQLGKLKYLKETNIIYV
ncbi:MAG: hypothetical protein EU532_00910 [Promethearchaeota archaeon]|nr:MAG: hypothetical protein EU532_00910 [Candidatus Lokiarchaeota archaeon]